MATTLEMALRSVVQQIQSYRANREHPRAPFPAEIWQNLSQLAQVHGTSEVAKHARVDQTTLASHVSKLQAQGPEFVECVVSSEPATFAATIEFESRVGERMRIQAPNLRSSDLSLLLREFLAK